MIFTSLQATAQKTFFLKYQNYGTYEVIHKQIYISSKNNIKAMSTVTIFQVKG